MKIFEVLNDRGVDLKKTDIIRTRIIQRLQQDASQAEYEEYLGKWESVVEEFNTNHKQIVNFLRTYFVATETGLHARGEIGDHLLEAFSPSEPDEESRKLDSHLTTLEDTKDLLDDLVEYANSYHEIIDPENYGIDFGEERDEALENDCNRILRRLTQANTTVWQPLVLAVYHDVKHGDLDKQEFLRDLFGVVESLTVRLYVSRDVHVKDNTYAAAVEAYETNGLDEEVIEELTNTARDENSQLFGEPLVELLCEAQWRQDMGKQLLRKISSESLADDEEEIIQKELTDDDTVVHLEHVLPQTPIRDDASDKYAWLRNFFGLSEGSEFEEDSLRYVINGLIENEDDERLEDLVDSYIHDLGNLVLLRGSENIGLGNDLFSRKAYIYNTTSGFDELSVNEYVAENHIGVDEFENLERYYTLKELLAESEEDDYEDAVEKAGYDSSTHEEFIQEAEEELANLEDSIEDFDRRWTGEEVTEHKIEMLEEVAESIELLEDEFDGVDYREIAEEEGDRRQTVITANFKRFI